MQSSSIERADYLFISYYGHRDRYKSITQSVSSSANIRRIGIPRLIAKVLDADDY